MVMVGHIEFTNWITTESSDSGSLLPRHTTISTNLIYPYMEIL